MTQSFMTLIDASTLKNMLTSTRVIDCRARLGDPDFGQRAFSESHVVGAVRGDLDSDFAGPPGRHGRHPLPDLDRLVARCREWGIDNTSQVVVYDDLGGMFAARAWWLLRSLGHATVAVLDGGWQAWLAMSGVCESQIQTPLPGNFSRRSPLTRQTTAEAVLARPPACLLDARAEERFAGIKEPIDHTAGHIPGARCLPASGNLTPEQHFQPAADLWRRFGEIGDDCVCYCGSGVTAAHNILAMRVAGLPEPALYPGSWSEWIEDPTRPIARGP